MSLKFNESDFRDKKNPEELIQRIFTINYEGEIDKLFKESKSQDFKDKIKDIEPKIWNLGNLYH